MGNIKVFYFFNFLYCFRLHWPIAIIYFAEITGSYATAMAVFSVVFLSQSLLEVPTGIFSDYIGRRKTLIIGAFSSFLSILLYALGMNFIVLVIGAIFEGLCRSLFSGTKRALLYETLKDSGDLDNYEHYLGKTESMYQSSLGLSALLGGILAYVYSVEMIFWVSVIPQLGCFIFAFKFKNPKSYKKNVSNIYFHFKDSIKKITQNNKLKLISIAEIIDFGFGESLFYFQAAFFKMVIPEWLIGIVRSINHLCGALSFWFSGMIIKKIGHKKSLIGGGIISTGTDYLALLFPTFLSPFIMAFTTIFYGVSSTARGGLMQREFSDEQRSTMDSIVSLMGSICFSIVSVFLGFMADTYSPINAMLIALTGNLLVIVIYFRIFKKVTSTKI